MSNTIDRQARRPAVATTRTGRIALAVLAAVAASLMVNTGIALAVTSTHPSGTQTGLMPIHYGPLTVIGVLAGTVGWAVIRRNAARPRHVLRAVVPVVVVLSLLPDVVLLLGGSSLVNVVGLTLMHLAIAAITVPVLARNLPLPSELPTTQA